jgi:hypothetical protein
MYQTFIFCTSAFALLYSNIYLATRKMVKYDGYGFWRVFRPDRRILGM